jgi:hypothetical protein
LSTLRLFVAASALILNAASPQTASIELVGGAFKVAGWAAPPNAPVKGWVAVLVVYAGAGNVPPLLGLYAVEGGALVFHPRFPPAAGVRYRAVFYPPGGGAAVERVFDGPSRDITPTARVEHVYPSGDVLPVNQLRLYVYFSAPMSQGEAGRRIRVLDESGTPLPDIFLPGEELWDPGFQRLTMTFDPGRIKRGLTSNQAMGPPLASGKRYTLAIDRGWPDARGAPLVSAFRKPFRGGPAERTPPDPRQWRLTAPQAGTAGSLIVDFPTPMNYALLQRMLRVSNGRAGVDGSVSVDHQETRWIYTSRQAWMAGDYQLVVDTGIEDLAGNHIGQAFDIDVFERVTERITAATVSLPFRVR